MRSSPTCSQLLHADDGMISLPRPHVATMVTTLWALTEFRPDNGGTGYSMYRNVMGHIDRTHPLHLLGVERPPEMIWEKMDRERSEGE